MKLIKEIEKEMEREEMEWKESEASDDHEA